MQAHLADWVSGGRWDRPKLHKLIDQARESATKVVVRLERISRSLPDLLGIIEQIKAKGARFKAFTEAVEPKLCLLPLSSSHLDNL